MIHTNYCFGKNLTFTKIFVREEQLDGIRDMLPKYQKAELDKTLRQLEGPDMQNAAADLFINSGKHLVVGADNDQTINLSLRNDPDGNPEESALIPASATNIGAKLLATALNLSLEAMKGHESKLKQQVNQKVQQLAEEVKNI